MHKLKKDILQAVDVINNSKIKNIKPRPKTIQSFLKGKNKSTFYGNVFIKHPDVCGTHPGLYLQILKRELRILVEHKQLRLQEKDYIVPHKEKEEKCFTNVYSKPSKLKTVTKDEFLRLTNWDKGFNHTSDTKVIQTLDGWNYPCDSKEEISLIKKLNKNNSYLHLRGQSLKIPYTTIKSKKVKNYYPDIVLLTKDYYVVIIEVKPLLFMSNYYNLEKYKALKAYAEEHGYMYTMCDRNFKSIEYLESKKIPKKTKNYFYNILECKKCFKDTHFKQFTKGLSMKKKQKIQQNFCSLVIQERLINKSKYSFDISSLMKIRLSMKNLK